MIKNKKTLSRILKNSDWNSKKNSSSLADTNYLRELRHQNILKQGFDLPVSVGEAEDMYRDEVIKNTNIPNPFINSIRGIENVKELSQMILQQAQIMQVQNKIPFENAFSMARSSIIKNSSYEMRNSLYEQNMALAQSVNARGGSIMNPYEAQGLFELTSLGYQGVMIPINESFSTTLHIVSNMLDSYDINGLYLYMIRHNALKSIKTAIIDSSVYGGGIITPIYKIGKEPYMLKDLRNLDIYDFFGEKNMSLEALMTFDRYCVVPEMYNDGMYLARIMSDAPIELRTIFGDDAEVLSSKWYAKFSADAESRVKLLRPDGFGISIFARAGKAVYNYEQQIKFLNYALSQLSIVVFNSKTSSFEDGGSADTAWNSVVAGSQMQDVKQQLSAMQRGMTNETGLFLNDIEVTTLNRTFTGIDSIINAMNNQAANAFGLDLDLLFGIKKSNVSTGAQRTTPLQIRQRENFRSPITQVAKWLILGYFAERNWQQSLNGGKEFKKWNLNDFKNMLEGVDIVYNDSLKSADDSLKEYGIDHIYKLLEAKILPIRTAINYVSSIPLLSKAFDNEDDLQNFINKVENLQNIGIESAKTEQEAIKEVNQSIIDLKDKNLERDEVKLDADGNPVRKVDISSFGDKKDNGVIMPISSTRTQTMIDPTQADRKKSSHE